jgi:hypothetical protein
MARRSRGLRGRKCPHRLVDPRRQRRLIKQCGGAEIAPCVLIRKRPAMRVACPKPRYLLGVKTGRAARRLVPADRCKAVHSDNPSKPLCGVLAHVPMGLSHGRRPVTSPRRERCLNLSGIRSGRCPVVSRKLGRRRRADEIGDNIDYVPIDQNLGTHTYWWARSPQALAGELRLDEEKMRTEFDGFQAFFGNRSGLTKHGAALLLVACEIRAAG